MVLRFFRFFFFLIQFNELSLGWGWISFGIDLLVLRISWGNSNVSRWEGAHAAATYGKLATTRTQLSYVISSSIVHIYILVVFYIYTCHVRYNISDYISSMYIRVLHISTVQTRRFVFLHLFPQPLSSDFDLLHPGKSANTHGCCTGSTAEAHR